LISLSFADAVHNNKSNIEKYGKNAARSSNFIT